MDIINFDTEKFYLGSLCKRGHKWNGTGKTLRRKDNKGCPECQKEMYKQHVLQDPEWHKKKYQSIRETSLRCNRQFHERNPEYRREYNLKYLEENRDKIKQQRRKRYQENREQILANQRIRLRKYYTEHRDEVQARRRKRFNRNPDYFRAQSASYSRKRRAIKKINHHTEYSLDQVNFLYQKFGYECAYCGSKEKLTIDHFIAISKGGPDCLGNLIPACAKCNSSKHNSDPMEWYKLQPFYSIKRWKKILNVLGKKESNYAQLPLL